MRNKTHNLLNTVLAFVAIALLCSCNSHAEQKTFTGYLVAKENKNTHQEAGIVPPLILPPRHLSKKTQYIWYVANKYEVIQHSVDSALFNQKQCGDLVTVNL